MMDVKEKKLENIEETQSEMVKYVRGIFRWKYSSWKETLHDM